MTFMIVAFLVLIVCRLRVSSTKEITAEIKREIKNKGLWVTHENNRSNINLEYIYIYIYIGLG